MKQNGLLRKYLKKNRTSSDTKESSKSVKE